MVSGGSINSIYRNTLLMTMLTSLLLLIGLIPVEANSAPVKTTTMVGDAQQSCKNIFEKIEKQLETASKIEECKLAFELYKDNLMKCHSVTLEEIGIFPMVSFPISDCFAKLDSIEQAKEVIAFSLKHPNWEAPGESKCDGHEMWKEALESLELFEKNPPRCESQEALLAVLEKFKKTGNFSLLKNIRGLHFGRVAESEECMTRFSEFEAEAKEEFKDAKLVINILKNKEKDEPGYLYAAVQGSKTNPDLVLVLIFSSFNANPNEAMTPSPQEGELQEAPQKMDMATPTQDEKPCYYLTDYMYYDTKQALLEDGFVFEK